MLNTLQKQIIGKTVEIFYLVFAIFLLINFIFMLTLSMILLLLGLSLGLKLNLDREKTRPFECGFTPKFSARLPFSIRFFLIALIFLIFDVELILIFPVIPAILGSGLFNVEFFLWVVLLILLLGLSHEVFQGSLSWAN